MVVARQGGELALVPDEARARVAAAGQKEGSTESTPETESTLIK